MIEIKVYQADNVSHEVLKSVSLLLQDSFAERREQGINFRCGTYSAKDVENVLIGSGGGIC